MLQPKSVSTLLVLTLASLGGVVPLAAEEPTPKPSPAPRPQVLISPEALGDCRGAGMARAQRPYLGVEATPLTPELRRHFGSPEKEGVLVSRLIEGGPAERAGIAVGDVLTRCADAKIEEPRDLRSAVRDHKGGESVTVELYRDGKKRQLKVDLVEKESCAFDIGQILEPSDLEELSRLGDLKHLEELKALEHLDIDVGGLDIDALVRNAVKMATVGLDQALKNKDWEQDIEKLQEGRAEEIEKRMEEVARQLEKLEQRLQAESGRYADQAKAEVDRARADLRRELEQRKQEIEKEAQRKIDEVTREAEKVRQEAARKADEARQRAEKAASGGNGGGIAEII